MKTVLVIDDQQEVLDTVSFMLSTEGYHVLQAESGPAGLVEARRARPDLIVCDVMMPEMNGHEVLRAVRNDLELAPTPFIFLTAKAAPEDLREGMNLGADDYITKPITVDELSLAVEAQLGKYAALRERFEQQLDLLRQGLSTMLPHELRTPLTLILGYSSLLLDGTSDMEESVVQESVRTIHESGLRLHRLVENLLLYVELEGDASLRLEHPRTSDPAAAVEEAARAAAARHGREDDLAFDLAASTVRVHRFHLQKIAAELVDNAIKFSERGSPVTVTLKGEGGVLVLRITDAGRGMTDDAVGRLQPYFQVNRRRQEQAGLGLGLSIARRLVTLYRGDVAIRSAPGRGTTVAVTIPGVWGDEGEGGADGAPGR